MKFVILSEHLIRVPPQDQGKYPTTYWHGFNKFIPLILWYIRPLIS